MERGDQISAFDNPLSSRERDRMSGYQYPSAINTTSNNSEGLQQLNWRGLIIMKQNCAVFLGEMVNE